ncbi:hypothetical protein K501DRAFT_198296, partial [Backusella circina FSU 941]
SDVLMLGNNLPGGLIKKNKSSAQDQDRPIFKVPELPRVSKLGLDVLADKKRAESTQLGQSKTKKVKMNWDDEDGREQDVEMDDSNIKRQRPSYRSQRMETPSNPGGISESALKRMEDMKRKDRNRGAGYSSRDDHKRSSSRKDDDDRERDRGRERDRERSRGEGSSTQTPRRGGLIKRSDWSSMTPRDAPFTPRSAPGNMTPRHDSGYRKSTGGSTSRKSTDWNYMTPAVKSTAYDEVALEYPEEFEGDDHDRQKWEEEQAQLDREWYQMEDGGVSRGAMDETHNPFAAYETHDKAKEDELAQKQLKKLSARQAQYNRDTDMWEASRMLSSGVAQRIEVDTDFDEENENRVHVLVHDIKPPFLDGRMVFTKQLEAVQHVRDPTSDMAIISRKGSRLVREKREQAERQKATKFDLAGTTLGNVMGVKEEKKKEEEHDENEDVRGDSKFASHLKSSEAVSEFARTRTMREQREYLPVFAVRQDLLNVVRDNQGKEYI